MRKCWPFCWLQLEWHANKRADSRVEHALDESLLADFRWPIHVVCRHIIDRLTPFTPSTSFPNLCIRIGRRKTAWYSSHMPISPCHRLQYAAPLPLIREKSQIVLMRFVDDKVLAPDNFIGCNSSNMRTNEPRAEFWNMRSIIFFSGGQKNDWLIVLLTNQFASLIRPSNWSQHEWVLSMAIAICLDIWFDPRKQAIFTQGLRWIATLCTEFSRVMRNFISKMHLATVSLSI